MAKRWRWERINNIGSVTEHTLDGPKTVLCRYWGDEEQTQEARIIEMSNEMYIELVKLLDEDDGLSPELDNLRKIHSHINRT